MGLNFIDEETLLKKSPDSIKGVSSSTEEVDDLNWGIGKVSNFFDEQFDSLALDEIYTWRATTSGAFTRRFVSAPGGGGGNPGMYHIFNTAGSASSVELLADGVGNSFGTINLSATGMQEVSLECGVMMVGHAGTGYGHKIGLYADENNYIVLDGSGDEWDFACKSGGTETKKTLSITNDEVWINFKIIADRGSAVLFVNGEFKTKINTNIPKNSNMSPYIKFLTTTSGDDEMYIKYLNVKISKTK